MTIKVKDILTSLSKLIESKSPRASHGHIFIGTIPDALGIFIETPPTIEGVSNEYTKIVEEHEHSVWFNYRGLVGIIAQDNMKVSITPVLYYSGSTPEDGYLLLNDNPLGDVTILPILLELYYLVDTMDAPGVPEWAMIVATIKLKTGTYQEKLDALIYLGYINRKAKVHEDLVNAFTKQLVGEC